MGAMGPMGLLPMLLMRRRKNRKGTARNQDLRRPIVRRNERGTSVQKASFEQMGIERPRGGQ
jgi:hypothetical protein